jgi:hypothetical protein
MHMTRSAAPALAISHGLLRLLIVLNFLAGLFLVGLLVTSFVAGPFVVDGLGMVPMKGSPAPMMALRAIILVGLASVPLAHILFTRLLAIVGTVGAGNAFAARNAGRLRACAWALLGMEGLHLLVGAIYATLPFKLGWSFSATGLLAVLLLFVLAQVFAQGAAMRDDLEGTV